MASFTQFIPIDPLVGLSVALLIFLITVFLTAKQYIGFSIAFLLLLFTPIAGLIVTNHSAIRDYFLASSVVRPSDRIDFDKFQSETEKTFIDLKAEFDRQNEKLHTLTTEVNALAESIETEKNRIDALSGKIERESSNDLFENKINSYEDPTSLSL